MFGNGKTALKVTLNKYLEGLGTTGFGPAQVSDAPNPINRLLNTTQRVWADADRDFMPRLRSEQLRCQRRVLALDNAAIFGTLTPGTSYDPDLMTGWGKRSFNWEFTTSVQQELVPRMSLDVQYARRWYGNIRVMDDLAVTPARLHAVPDSPRRRIRGCPNGGGYPLTGLGLSPTAAAQSYFVTLSDNYGKQTEHFDGVNITVNARLQNGLLLQGGIGTGRQVTNDCEVVDDLPEMLHTFFGDPTRRVLLRGAAGGVLRAEQRVPHVGPGPGGLHDPEDRRAGQRHVPEPAGRRWSQCQRELRRHSRRRWSGPFIPFQAFQIVQPGELFIERLNQIDFRVSKIFRFGHDTHELNFDFYNVTNSNSVLGENFAYGTAWTATDIDPAAAPLQDRRAVRLLNTKATKITKGTKSAGHEGPAPDRRPVFADPPPIALHMAPS